MWKEKINQNWDHKTNTHVLWNTINNLQIYTHQVHLNHLKIQNLKYMQTTLSSHKNIHTADQNLQLYLNETFNWTLKNDLQLNVAKSSATLSLQILPN